MNAVLEAGDARHGADQSGRELAGVQVPPPSPFGGIVAGTGGAALGAQSLPEGSVLNDMDKDFFVIKAKIDGGNTPRTRQPEDLLVKVMVCHTSRFDTYLHHSS